MDEYIYISEQKLSELMPGDRRWWARIRAKRVRADVQAGPVRVGIDVEADLVRAAAKIHKAEVQAYDVAKWYTDETLTAGDWMFFEGRIGWRILDRDSEPGAVLFCQLPPPAGARWVLLHGSAAHMKIHSESESNRLRVLPPWSDPTTFPKILQRVAADDRDPMWTFWRQFGRADPATAERDLRSNLAELHITVTGNEWFQASAPFLEGFGRVSGIVTELNGYEVVIGSPFLVRRARPGE